MISLNMIIFVFALTYPAIVSSQEAYYRNEGHTTESYPRAPITTYKPHHHSFADKYIATLIKLNWHAAYAYCEQNGWELLRIETDEDQFDLENFLNFFNLQNETFWTAGNNLVHGNYFHWSYNGPFFHFTNWAVGQPDNFMNREHCVRLIESYTQWDDYPCAKELHFICQRYGNTEINGRYYGGSAPYISFA